MEILTAALTVDAPYRRALGLESLSASRRQLVSGWRLAALLAAFNANLNRGSGAEPKFSLEIPGMKLYFPRFVWYIPPDP